MAWDLTLERCLVEVDSLHCLLHHGPLDSCPKHSLPVSVSLALVHFSQVAYWRLRRENESGGWITDTGKKCIHSLTQNYYCT